MRRGFSFITAYAKKLPLWLICVLVLLTGSLYVFGLIIHEIFWEKEDDFDLYIFNFVSDNLVSPGITSFMQTITHFASSAFLQIGYAIILAVYMYRRKWKTVIEVTSIAIGGYIMNKSLKALFARTRPEDPLIDGVTNFSFPSGHATSAFIFYGLLVYLVWRSDLPGTYKYLLGILLICLSLFIGFSRIYLRVHYPTDVLAGFCTGFAWLLLSLGVSQFLAKKNVR